MLRDELRGHAVDAVHGLADDLDIADNRILHLRVLLERGAVGQRLNIGARAPNGFGNVLEIILNCPTGRPPGLRQRRAIGRIARGPGAGQALTRPIKGSGTR